MLMKINYEMCRYCQKTVRHSVSVVEGVQPIVVVSDSKMR